MSEESLREEITRRGWWVIKHHGHLRPNSPRLKCRDAVAGEFLLRLYLISGDGGDYEPLGSNNYFLVFTGLRDGKKQIEFSSNPDRLSRDPDYDEWHRILNALRKKMVLDDLADV